MCSRSRCLVRWAILACASPLGAGCAKVDPAADFERVRATISERTGTEAYDPATDDAVSASVDALLQDGLTVEKAVQVAFLSNRVFQAMFYEIGASRADVVQSTLLTNPSFGLLARFPEGGGRANLELSIGQELVDLWQIPVRRKVAEAQLEQVMMRVAARAVELRAEVRSRCYELLAARQLESTAGHNLQLMEQVLNLSEAQLEAGQVSRFDVNLQRGPLLDVRLALLQAQRERRLAEVALERVLNMSGRSVQLAGELPTPQPLPDDEMLLRAAAEHRLEIRAGARRVQEAEAALRQETLEVFPSLMAGFGMERSERQALPGRDLAADTLRSSVAGGGLTAPDIESRAQRDQSRRQIIDAILGPSVQITLPIWDQNQAQIARAQYVVEQRRRELDGLLNGIAADVERASAGARAAYAIHQFYIRESLPQAESNVEGARRLYQQGEQGILTLIEAQRVLVTRRAAAVEALRGYWVAMAELEAAAGGRLERLAQGRPASTQAAGEGAS